MFLFVVNFLLDVSFVQYSAFSLERLEYVNEGVFLQWNNDVVTEI